jgi:hypothetical protein
MTMTQTQNPTTAVNQVNLRQVRESEERMINQKKSYAESRLALVKAFPAMEETLPKEWPQSTVAVDQDVTIKALRKATSALNEGLLIVGFGDGSILNYLRQDPRGRMKLIHMIVLPCEMVAYAHALGTMSLGEICQQLRISFCLARNLEEVRLNLQGTYGHHGSVARLAGTAILDSHSLTPAAEELRKEWLPQINKTIIERFDSIGNDVYDTFLGAKHALMHGDKVMRKPRSSDYRNRYKGKTALCIASGPSMNAYIEQIKAVQHEHVIICADSIFGCLLDHGIQPDFVTMVERNIELGFLVKDNGPRSTSVLFALPVVHTDSTDPFDGRVAWWWNSDDLYPWIDPKEPFCSSGRSAGTMCVALAGLLGVKTAYLIGHDLAYKNGKTHADGVAAFTAQGMESINSELSRDNPNYYHRLIDAPKNGGGTLVTSGVWEIFRADNEAIIANCRETEFVNLNILTGEGAKIAGAVAGSLPEKSGIALEKSHPQRNVDEQACSSYIQRCKNILSDCAKVEERFLTIKEKLIRAKPLQYSRKEVEKIGEEVDLTGIVSSENRAWFAYVFRAALRNLMVKLHHNTFVGTMAERNWNQIQVMRLYVDSIPNLIKHIRPELEQALESFK